MKEQSLTIPSKQTKKHQFWQKQRELEKLNLKPEEILEEEEKRTNPICIEEQSLPRNVCLNFITKLHGFMVSRPANIISYNYLIILSITRLVQNCYLYLLVSSAKLLNDAYRTEKNGDVRERLLLVRRVLVDNEQTARVAHLSLARYEQMEPKQCWFQFCFV